MLPPTVDDLPTPSRHREDWPWHTEGGKQNRVTKICPRISIVTPSYNQGEYLEATLRSVLLQGYPDLEYIVMDGGSEDNSVATIQRYSDWLSSWQSQPDGGQSAAINAGWQRSTGSIVAWLNSDDILYPGALAAVADAFTRSDTGFVYGGCDVIDAAGAKFRTIEPWPYNFHQYLGRWASPIAQPATFMRSDAVVTAGMLDERLHVAMDYDLWLRLGATGRGQSLPQTLAAWRYYDNAKTSRLRGQAKEEVYRAYRKLARNPLVAATIRDAARRRGHEFALELARESLPISTRSFIASVARQPSLLTNAFLGGLRKVKHKLTP